MTPTILLVNDTSDQENWGCQATSTALKRLLRDAVPGSSLLTVRLGEIRKEFHEYSIPGIKGKMFESFGGNPFEERRISRLRSFTNRVRKQGVFSSYRRFFPEVVDEYDQFAGSWLEGGGGPVGASILKKIKNCDAVVFNGEGSVYGRAKKGTRALFVLYLAKEYLNRPSFIVNHTAHIEASVPILKGMVNRVYGLMDGISVREPVSKRNLQQHGVEAQIRVAPDAVFSLDLVGDASQLPNRTGQDRYVCLGASSLVSDAKPWQPRIGFEDLAREFMELGLRVVFVAKDASDWFLGSVAEKMGCRFFGPDQSYRELFSLLSGASLFVTGRFHPIALAAMAGCPFVPLTANTHKIEGICEFLEYPIDQPIDILNLQGNVDSIIEKGKELMSSGGAISDRLQARAGQFRLLAREHATAVADVLGGDELARH